MTQILTKTNLGSKGFIWLTAQGPLSREAKAGTQGRNLEAEAEVETVEESPAGFVAQNACLTCTNPKLEPQHPLQLGTETEYSFFQSGGRKIRSSKLVLER